MTDKAAVKAICRMRGIEYKDFEDSSYASKKRDKMRNEALNKAQDLEIKLRLEHGELDYSMFGESRISQGRSDRAR